LKTAAGNAQSAMILSVRKIFEPGGGANDYTPSNTPLRGAMNIVAFNLEDVESHRINPHG
jgi:hypothetical protein